MSITNDTLGKINFNPRSPCGERRLRSPSGPSPLHFNPRSPCGERPRRNWLMEKPAPISIHAPRVGSDGIGTERKGRRSISIHAPRVGSDSKDAQIFLLHLRQKGYFCDILQIGCCSKRIGRKRRGDFLSRSVRTSGGKYGYLAFAFRESGGLQENRRFYSQSVLFSFRIDCQGSKIADCPFRGP